MSDGGFDVDKHIKKRIGATKIHSPIFNKKGKYYISFPDMEEGDGVEYVKRLGESTESKNTTKSEIIESNSSENLWIAGTIQQDGRKNEIKPTQEPSESKLSVTLASNENNSLAKYNISDRPSLDDQDKLSKISTTKPPLIKKNASFSERLKKGWTKEQLMKHYSLSEEEYEKLIACIKNIHKV